MIKILLVDDHTILRQGLRLLLSAQADMNIIGEGSYGIQAVRLAQRLRPDIIILDIALPELNGLEAARQILKENPKARIMILSMHKSIAYAAEAIKHGARAYIIKETDDHSLIQAIRQVARGEIYLSPPFTLEEIEEHWRKMATQPLDPLETLTNRERLVLQLAAGGMTSLRIAGQLGISVRTVEDHRANLQRKLGLRGQAELVRFALQHGLLLPDSES